MQSFTEPRVQAGGKFLPRVLDTGHKAEPATGAGFQTIYTLLIPGGTLGTTAGLRIKFHVRQTTGTGNGTWRLQYGGITVYAPAAMPGASHVFDIDLWADGSINAQRCAGWNQRAGLTSGGIATVDSSVEQSLTFEVDLATDGDVFTLDWASVEVLE